LDHLDAVRSTFQVAPAESLVEGHSRRTLAFTIEEVTAAVRDAIARGAIGFDAVKHLVLCRIERRPPRLDLAIYPLPRATVATTSAKAYLDLCRGAAA
jgi:hypothetical protein